jgi:tetratricopeptide (TPR) repeat protein
MDQLSMTDSAYLDGGAGARVWRLCPGLGGAARPTGARDLTEGLLRTFEVDADFERGGVWAGVADLAEAAYLDLTRKGETALVEEHLPELHSALLAYRDRIRPRYLCLTDTASADEKTRFYAVDRAYRLEHGLVGMILQWKREQLRQERWVVIVRNFDRAQNLATRFFVELARRAKDGTIEVVVEAPQTWSNAEVAKLGACSVVATTLPSDVSFGPAASTIADAAEIRALVDEVAADDDAVFERRYPALLAHYRAAGEGLAAARVAVRIFIIYNSYGFYHEARHFIGIFLPHFEELVAGDQSRRIHYVSKMNICLVMTDDPDGALWVVDELAGAHLSRPHLVANMNYILAMHFLRYAQTKNLERAEHHILIAVEKIAQAKADPDFHEYPFQKVFIDNGLAFLRARQGRHQEALDLCKDGYEFLTRELGEERHLLHRSVLQYNIAQVCVMLGRLDEGREHYWQAIGMDPNYSEYYNELGNILQEQEQYQGAVELYAAAIKRSAPYPEVFFNKAVCHLRLGDLDAALADFETSLDLNPDQRQAHALRADILREQGSAAEALHGYDAAIRLGWDSAAIRVNRAVLHFNNGAFGLALTDMNQAIALDPDDPDHYENRAAIHAAMDRRDLYLRDLGLMARCRELAS